MGHSFYNKLKDKNGSIDFTKIRWTKKEIYVWFNNYRFFYYFCSNLFTRS
jgi:hypothetical protein